MHQESAATAAGSAFCWLAECECSPAASAQRYRGRDRQWWAVPWRAALRCLDLVIRARPFCEPGGSPIPPTDSPPTSPYVSPPTPPPPPSPDAPQRRSSQQPGLRAEGNSWLANFAPFLSPLSITAVAPPLLPQQSHRLRARNGTSLHLIPPARRLFFFYDTPTYVTRHDAHCNGCCALRDPDRRRWQV